jgi:uncharacterized protein (TIGR02453 family)
MAFEGFSKDFFKFFLDLKKNNERPWFEANKDRYKEVVVAPIQDFIIALAPKLAKVSDQIRCDPRPNGGSMFRIYRDTRFSKDKTPYKTAAGIQFRHVFAKDFRAPGYYLHLEPGEVFFGGGMYMPEPPALLMVRQAIANDPTGWKKARDAASIKRAFGGLEDFETLAKAPRGFAPDHPLIEDIRRKSFFVTMESNEADAGKPAFVTAVAKAYADATPLMGFLCKAVGARF